MFEPLLKEFQKKFKQFDRLFVVDVNREEIYQQYLDGFPDPVVKQGNNCNCCKSFLRQFGGIVTIKDNKTISLWDDLENIPEEYQQAVLNLKKYVHSREIEGIFLGESPKLGTAKNFDPTREVYWKHFNLEVASSYVKPKDRIPTIRGEIRSKYDVFYRGLTEIPTEAVETVLDLIAQNSLYRGNEHKANLDKFLELQRKFKKLKSNKEKSAFVWSTVQETPIPISNIRNTSIGTLLNDLTDNMELDKAVSRYEKVVAPTNYKRPTALITPRMIEEAQKQIKELGYEDSLHRRFAKSSDLSVANVIFAYKKPTLDNIFSEMAADTEFNPKTLTKVEEISIDDFISKIIPNSKKIEVLLENSHLGKMTSLFTAEIPESPTLFKWNNNFSWGYTGDITDSIKERVKQAGGSVTGVLRVSLSWSNYDDLDLHLYKPGNGRVWFADRGHDATGKLDVDMNAGGGTSRTPVENITFGKDPTPGHYKIHVNNYRPREGKDQGYTVQVEYKGEIFDFTFDKNKDEYIEFDIKNDGIVFSNGQSSKLRTNERWGLKTNRFYNVTYLLNSPNFWEDNKVGNKHFMFILENCNNDEQPRSIFNEYLKPELDKHRKVFEVLGGKLKVANSTEQLSGIGFSDTQRSHVYVRVEGKFKRILKVNF